MQTDPGDVNARTLTTYEANADRYIELSPTPSPLVDVLLDAVPARSRVLELGSGPGRDALRLEAGGLIVDRTDGARSFVDIMRSAGHRARVVNIMRDDLGGPYDAIFANAVLLHIPRPALAGVLRAMAAAVREGGALAATVKKGASEEWTSRKLDALRHFTYWTEGPLRATLDASGWSPISIEDTTEVGAAEQWITVVAERKK